MIGAMLNHHRLTAKLGEGGMGDAFQKKSKSGIKTPKQHIELVKERLKRAEEHYDQWTEKNKKKMR